MGLDMYLEARKFTGKEFFSPEMYASLVKAIDKPEMDYCPSITVNVQVAYWRKANAIHQWFVTNVQNNVDDCAEYHVTRDQLITLKTICNSVVKEKNLSQAVAVLPTQSGFFFGSTEYDEYYFSDLEDTMKQIDFVLENYPDEEGWSFIYHSSW
jgi:hypothetical protein